MISDMHVHSWYSSDSQAPAEEQIRRAMDAGMAHIAITDHQDYDFPPGHLTYLLLDTGDTKGYLEGLRRLKEKYAGQIEVLLGLELGLQPHLGEMLDRYVRSHPFDFIIGSTHCFSGRDTEDPSLYEGRSEEDACREYFVTELENLRATDAYDVAGHLDFVLRDLPSRNRHFSYGKYGDILDEILRTLIDKGKGLECNTKGLYIGMGQPNPDISILRRYRELGGEILTFGSDAHRTDRVGLGFDQAAEIAKQCGFSRYCVFKERKPVFLPLE